MAQEATFKLVPIQVDPGVNLDDPPSATTLYTNAHWMRDERGLPQNIKGFRVVPFNGDPTYTTIGAAPITSIHNQFVNSLTQYIYGSATGLISTIGDSTQATNITPLNTATIAAANSLGSQYITLANNPVTTTNASTTVSIAINATGNYIRVGDTVNISGLAGTVGGINTATLVNGQQIVRSVSGTALTIILGTAATSGATGGGAAGIVATKYLTLTKVAHGLREGERVKIAGAADTAGVLAANINGEKIIRLGTTGLFLFPVSTFPTSSVAAGGGAATTYQTQIADGAINASTGFGYGLGNYGAGTYGTGKTGSTLNVQPRIWFFGLFGQQVIMTPGLNTPLYVWDYNQLIAPTQIGTAPSQNGYVFVVRNIVVSLGANGIPNRVQWTDTGDYTSWTPTTTNYAGGRTLFESDALVSHAVARGENILLFTPTQVFVMRYVDDQLIVWDFQSLASQGIIAPLARSVANGVPYWMGQNGFYTYSGGVVTEVPCPMREYVFNNINRTQARKCFSWYNESREEIWFFWPNNAQLVSSSPYEATILNLKTGNWWCAQGQYMDFAFTAAEPNQLLTYPVLAQEERPAEMESTTSNMDENAVSYPLKAFVETPFFNPFTNQTVVRAINPESIQVGNIECTLTTRQYVQSTRTQKVDARQTVTPTTDRISTPGLEGRYWKYRIDVQRTSATLNAQWKAGKWMQEISGGAPGS